MRNTLEPRTQDITNIGELQGSGPGVLAYISLATFSINSAGKLKLAYSLFFINIHKGTK